MKKEKDAEVGVIGNDDPFDDDGRPKRTGLILLFLLL